MIRLENITKIYNEKVDDTKALDDVSLKICLLYTSPSPRD